MLFPSALSRVMAIHTLLQPVTILLVEAEYDRVQLTRARGLDSVIMFNLVDVAALEHACEADEHYIMTRFYTVRLCILETCCD